MIFQTIALHIGDLGSNYALTNTAPVSQNTGKQTAIQKLAERVRYDADYYDFVFDAHDRLLDRIRNNLPFLQKLRTCVEGRTFDNSAVADLLLMHNHAGSEAAGFNFPLPKLRFYSEPKDIVIEHDADGNPCEVEFIGNGTFYGNEDFEDPAIETMIRINMHDDTGMTMIDRLVAAYHESIHQQGYCLGHAYAHAPDTVPERLQHAGMLWAELERSEANVPCEYFNAYKAMFHEDVAWIMHEVFADDLCKILSDAKDSLPSKAPSPAPALA